MAHKIHKKCLSNAFCDSFILEKEVNIKKVAGVLSIECCADLSRIKVFSTHNIGNE